MNSISESEPARRSVKASWRSAVMWGAAGGLIACVSLAVAWCMSERTGALGCQLSWHAGLLLAWGVPCLVYSEIRRRGAMNFLQVMLLRFGSLPIFATFGMLAHVISALLLPWIVGAWGSKVVYWTGALLFALNVVLLAAHWAARAWFQAGRRSS